MKILHELSGREAKAIKGRNDSSPVFKCFPAGSKKNLDSNAVKFHTVQDAAEWLRDTPGGGIRVAAIGTGKGQRTAILNKGLVIKHANGRLEKL